MTLRRVSKRNAMFQQWQALLQNRTKRNRAAEFLVHGVRPINIALERGWPITALLYVADSPLSEWAKSVLSTVDADQYAVDAFLLAELGEKDEPPEIVAVAGMPADDPARIRPGATGVVVVFDRPSAPGNLGTILRSADAFGAAGMIVTGHGADPYDPRTVRASTGSLFAVPTVRLPSHREVLDWAERLAHRPTVVGTDESGEVLLEAAGLDTALLLVIGNETRGMTSAWRQACDVRARIPIGGSSSSLNAAAAASIALYEIDRQRRN